jgi:CRP/FNR family transcriptional regulator, cyclic AMP receptor protein
MKKHRTMEFMGRYRQSKRRSNPAPGETVADLPQVRHSCTPPDEMLAAVGLPCSRRDCRLRGDLVRSLLHAQHTSSCPMSQNPATVASLLGKTAIFGPLSQADRLAVAGQMLKVDFRPGQTVFARGDSGRNVYLVVDGSVRLSVFSADGRLLSFKHANAGDIFGEIAALDGRPRTADGMALTRVVAMTLVREELDKLIESNPRVARAAIGWLCQRLRDTSAQAEAIALHPVEVRVARYLLSRLMPVPVGESAGGRSTVALGISQGELASLIGASRQKVNAALGLLENAGAIRRTGRRIACDPTLLARIATPE